MNRQIAIFVIFILFSLAGQSSAIYPWGQYEWDTAWWNPDAANSNWFDPNNWWIKNGESPLPDATLAIVNFNRAPDKPNGVALIIDANNTGLRKISCWSIWLPEWLEPARQDPGNIDIPEPPPPVHLTMTGGEVILYKDMVIGRSDHRCTSDKIWPDSGVLDMSGGSLTISKYLSVGGSGNDWGNTCGGKGVINLTGGYIMCGSLLVPEGTSGYETGTPAGDVNLFGGVIDTNEFVMRANGKMRVKGGVLNVLGNQVTTINSYIAGGKIVAGDTYHTLRVSYDSLADITTLVGVSADLSNDSMINYKDLKILADNWLATGQNVADINGDQKVNLKDFSELALQWMNIFTQ